MHARAHLSADATNPALNTDAHAAEHCAVDPELLDELGSALGRQLLVRQSDDRLALYTVAETLSAPRAIHVGTAGLARLQAATDTPRVRGFNAMLETDFTAGDPRDQARLTEELLGEDVTGLAIMAPHGGLIERYTDDQAELVYRALALMGKPIRGWIARGVNRATGAHTCWHITSSDICESSFPKLGSIFGSPGPSGPFAHAVAFHGHNDSETIVVGGGLPRDNDHTALKTRLARQIHDELKAVTKDPPVVEVRLGGDLAGVLPANVVNRITDAGNGIQIEQPFAVRKHKKQRAAVARAVAGFYAELI